MDLGQFEKRKKDHIKWSLDPQSQSENLSDWERVSLPHQALTELDLASLNLNTQTALGPWKTPFFISSMTAGHQEGEKINQTLLKAAAQKGWAFALGSQRRMFVDTTSQREWLQMKEKYSEVTLLGNLGMAQLLEFGAKKVAETFQLLKPNGLYIHLNPLQEALQPEGNTNFQGATNALGDLVQFCDFPILVKEVGCGITGKTAHQLDQLGVRVIDVSGAGGTHWGRVETLRSEKESLFAKAGKNFWNWGISTPQSLKSLQGLTLKSEVWASGGIRSGVHAAKAIALGAVAVGIAQPMMKAALESDQVVVELMKQFEYELKVALFCTGSKDPQSLREGKLI